MQSHICSTHAGWWVSVCVCGVCLTYINVWVSGVSVQAESYLLFHVSFDFPPRGEEGHIRYHCF